MVEGINNRLREIRLSQKGPKKSGANAAKFLGISPQYYYDIEKGERRLKAEIAIKMAEYFEVTVDYLFGAVDYNSFGTNGNNEKSPDSHEESELSEIPIEKLNQFKLVYKGHKLTKEEADDLTDLLEAALKRWKK